MKYPQLVSMPSAVSDWLEEQLEARGIDAVVYTRYVLSLLYCRDPVDIICPDQDLHFANPQKDVRRSSGSSGGSRKRFCRSYDFYHADADQLKRSAAIECLKSASDQKCGIESLVDELCAKLEEIQSDKAKKSSEVILKDSHESTVQSSKLSLQDSAKRYYAAFPALSGNTDTASQALKLRTTLIPKWVGSPKRSRLLKKPTRLGTSFDESNSTRGKQKPRKKDSLMDQARKSVNRSFSEWNFYGAVDKATKIEEHLEESVDESIYEDLPVDIRDLLESPRREMRQVINLSNMRNKGDDKFIQCGTNIISSIWSVHNDEGDSSRSTTEYMDTIWSNVQDETNAYFETATKEAWNNVGYKFQKWSDATEAPLLDENEIISKSLMKINHNKEKSCFTKVQPSIKAFPIPLSRVAPKNQEEDNKEDLLHSASSHFRPINEKQDLKLSTTVTTYADGTTFVIPSNLEKIDFKRSESGSMLLDVEYEKPKKYFELKMDDDNSNLTLKFSVKQNDKACQTDYDILRGGSPMEFYFPGDKELLESEEEIWHQCTCNKLVPDDLNSTLDYSLLDCPIHEAIRPDSMMAELFGKETKCDKCNEMGSKMLKTTNIWSGGEICMGCLKTNGGETPPGHQEQHNQLREDITQDGEQLLMDLSSLQRSYMEEMPVNEISCDLDELVGIKKEWRRAAGIHTISSRSAFSFATRLQQDCLIKMTTIPTLRSVTL